jgi:hypothetical protein
MRASAGRAHQAQLHHVEPDANDPLHEPQQSRLVRQLGAKSCRAWPSVTVQSSNTARSVSPARPTKVISYVRDRRYVMLSVCTDLPRGTHVVSGDPGGSAGSGMWHAAARIPGPAASSTALRYYRS